MIAASLFEFQTSNLCCAHCTVLESNVVNAVHSAAAFPRQEAHADWQRFESDSDVQRDQFGPKASPLRLYSPVEDYVLRKDVSGFARERLDGTKAKPRPQGKDIEGIDRGLQEDMPKWSDERLSQLRETTTRLRPGPPRLRNKKYDEVQQSLPKERNVWSATLKSADETLTKFQTALTKFQTVTAVTTPTSLRLQRLA